MKGRATDRWLRRMALVAAVGLSALEASAQDGGREGGDAARETREGQPSGPAAGPDGPARPEPVPVTELLPGAEPRYYPGVLKMAPAWPDGVPRDPTMLVRDAARRQDAVTQIWLARVRFDGGIVDGRAGTNTRHALEAFQKANGLDPTGELDEETRDRLGRAAGADRRADFIPYEVTADDVDGPFSKLPEDLYMAHELECMCFETPLELLAEKARASEELIELLNPKVDFDALEAGTVIILPDPLPARPLEAEVTRVVVDTERLTLQAFDADGKLVAHYPTVVGEDFADYGGGMDVTGIAVDGTYRLDPKMFDEIPDDRPVVQLPPGPNSPTGNVWIDLSSEGFGIHGTPTPRTIGHTESHGCVRLTNWNAAELLKAVEPGKTKVEFTR